MWARLGSGSRLHLLHAPPNGQMWHKVFFYVGPGAGPEPTRVRHFLKIPTAPSTFPLLGAPGNKPNPLTVVKAWGRRKSPVNKPQLARSVSKVWPIDWSGSRKPSGSRWTSYCYVFRYYGEWLSSLVGDSATIVLWHIDYCRLLRVPLVV